MIRQKEVIPIRRGKLWKIPVLILVVLLLLVVGSILYIQPTHNLNLKYSEVNWQNKFQTILATGQPEIELTEDEINNLAKQVITGRKQNTGILSHIKGLQLTQDGSALTADVNLGWGWIQGEAKADYQLSYEQGLLTLTPVKIHIRNATFSPEPFGLKSIMLNPSDYLPNAVKITNMTFDHRVVKIAFSLNLGGLGLGTS